MVGAPLRQGLHDVELGVGDVAVAAVQPRPLGGAVGTGDLAGQQPVGQREVGQHPHAVLVAGRHDVGLHVTLEQAVVVLSADERRATGRRGDVCGPGDLPAGEVAVAEVADLSLQHQLVQRGEGLLDGCHRVGRMQLIEVDVVGLQPAQARLDGPPDVEPAGLCAGRRAVAHVTGLVAELRRQHERVPTAPKGLAHQLLRPALPAVDVGGVEQRDASIDRRVQDGPGGVEVEPAAEVVAAEADDGDGETGPAEWSVAHAVSLPDHGYGEAPRPEVGEGATARGLGGCLGGYAVGAAQPSFSAASSTACSVAFAVRVADFAVALALRTVALAALATTSVEGCLRIADTTFSPRAASSP